VKAIELAAQAARTGRFELRFHVDAHFKAPNALTERSE
jgi:5-hydroxyisourate hydrolase-like protein (transthyretin family)